MIYCSHCGSRNKPDSKFCNNCGALLAEPTDVRCPICGSPNKVGNVYCGVCGGRLEAHATTSAEERNSLAPLPSVPFSLRGQSVPVAQAEAIGLGSSESQPEPAASHLEPPSELREPATTGLEPPAPEAEAQQPIPSTRQMPEWIARLQGASQLGETTKAETADVQTRGRTWLREFHEADDMVDGQTIKNGEDWLANLRAAAMIELESAASENEKTDSESPAAPVPQWFAYIRPPLATQPGGRETPPETSPGQTETEIVKRETEPASPQAESGLAPDVESPRIGQELDTQGLPDWLVELRAMSTAPQASPAAPAVESQPALKHEQPRPAAQEYEDISGKAEIPEWVREIPAPDPQLAASIDAGQEQLSSQSRGEKQSGALFSEAITAQEQPSTSEENTGLPEWLTAPIETEQLLSQVQAQKPQATQVDPGAAAPAEHSQDEVLGSAQAVTQSPLTSNETQEPLEALPETLAAGLSPESSAAPAKPTQDESTVLRERVTNTISEIQERIRLALFRASAPHEVPASAKEAAANAPAADVPLSQEANQNDNAGE